MSDPIIFGLFDATGAPAPAATPSFVGSSIFNVNTGAARTAPAFVNRGDGQHGFEPTNADETTGCIALIDAGVGFQFDNGSRYAAVTIPETASWESFLLLDGASAPWAGAAPGFQSYEGRSGPISAPSIIHPIAGLYGFVNNAAAVTAGVSYRIDAPVGAAPAYLFGSATPQGESVPYTPPSSGVYPADAVAQMLAGAYVLPDPPGGDGVTLVYAQDGNLLVGPVRAVEGVIPMLSVFVLQSGGQQPMPYMGQTESWHVTRVQVTVRSHVNQFAQGEALARALHSRIHLGTPPGYTYCLALDADPLFLGEDDDHTHRFTFNLDVGHRR